MDLRQAAYLGFRLLVRNASTSVLLPLLKRAIVERLPDGSIRPGTQSRPDGRIGVLFLSSDVFRGDNVHLAAAGSVRVLELPRRWLTRLFLQFYDMQPRRPQMPEYMNPSPTDAPFAYKQDYQRFLERLLPPLFTELGIDCVIGQHMHHIIDVDWGEVSQRLGRPYLVFHREAIVVSPVVRNRVRDRLTRLGRFQGAHIVVQNEGAVEACIESGFVDRDRITALGAIRMDALARDMKRLRNDLPENGTCVMFAFGLGLFVVAGDVPQSQFDKAHSAFLSVARNNPKRQFIIKCKPDTEGSWRKDFERLCGEIGVDPYALANLRITSDDDPHELIRNAAVVTSFNSTTLLEAGIAGRRVVVPYFDEVRQPEFRECLYFYPGVFDVFVAAQDEEEYMAALEAGLSGVRPITDAELAERVAVFEHYISPLDGRVTERFEALIHASVSDLRAAAE